MYPQDSRHRTEPSGGASGQASDIAIHAKEILRIRKLLTGIYQKHCARPDEAEAEGLQRFETALERDYFMTGVLCRALSI